MGSCHLSSIQTKPKQAKLYQSKLCQAKPWQAPTSPLPTYFLDGVEPIRVQKPKHPNPSTPQFRHNGTTSWPVSPARPAYRRWTEAPGDFGRILYRTGSLSGSPPLFFSVRFFSEKKRTTASRTVRGWGQRNCEVIREQRGLVPSEHRLFRALPGPGRDAVPALCQRRCLWTPPPFEKGGRKL